MMVFKSDKQASKAKKAGGIFALFLDYSHAGGLIVTVASREQLNINSGTSNLGSMQRLKLGPHKQFTRFVFNQECMHYGHRR